MSIRDTERATYQEMWAVEDYAAHAPGAQFLPVFMCHQPADRDVTILDAGTGSGKGALALVGAGFEQVRLCDVTDAGLVTEAKALPFYEACLWHDLSHATRAFGHPGVMKADWVYCTDVLEHIPPQFTMLAVDQMLRVARKGLFLSVSLVPDNFGVWVGKSLHQSVFPFTWWRDAIGELGTIVEARDFQSAAIFVVQLR